MKKLHPLSIKPILSGIGFALLLAAPSAHSASINWKNTNAGQTDFNSSANWSGTINSSSTTIFTTGAQVAQPNVSSDISIAAMTFNSGASGYDITATGASKITLLTGGVTNNGTNIVFDVGLDLEATGTVTLTSGTSASITYNGVIASGAGLTGLTISGAGTTTLNGANSYGGATLQSGSGTVIVGNKLAFSTGGVTLNGGSGTSNIQANANLTGSNKLANAITLGANLQIGNGSALEFGGTVNLGGVARTFTNNNTGGTTFSGAISNDGGNGLTITNAANATTILSGTNTYSGNSTIQGLGGVSITSMSNLGTGTTINLGNGSNKSALIYTGTGETTSKIINLAGGSGGGAVLDQSGTGVWKFTSNLTVANLPKTLVLQGSTTGSGEISGLIPDGGSSATTIDKLGSGVWVLSGANTYTGSTKVEQGTLVAGANSASGAAGAFGNSITAISLGSTSVSGAASVLTNGAYTIGRSITETSGATNSALSIGGNHATGTSTYSGSITLAMGTTLTAAAGGEVDFSGAIGNAASTANNVVIDGGGTVKLSATNTFGGSGNSVTIKNGSTLAASTGNANLGDAGNSVVFNNGTLQFGTAFDLTSRTVTISSGGATFDTNGNTVTFANAIGNGGTGGLTKKGTGSLTLNAANNYSGGTTITNGTLITGDNSALGSSSGGLTVGASGTLDLNGKSVTVGTLNGSNGGIITGSAGSILTATNGVFSGAIQSSASLIKSGSGKLTLTGTNTYTGNTLVNAGALVVNGSLGSTAVSVNSTASLGGSGSISGTVAINNGGTLTPGNSPGALSTGAQTWSTGGNYNWQIYDATGTAGTGYDVTNVTGTLILTGSSFDINLWSLSSSSSNGNAINFNKTLNYTWTLATTTLGVDTSGVVGSLSNYFVINTGAINGTSGFTNTLTPAGQFNVGISGNDLVLNYVSGVPEPGSVALALVGFSLVLWRIRRRRSE